MIFGTLDFPRRGPQEEVILLFGQPNSLAGGYTIAKSMENKVSKMCETQKKKLHYALLRPKVLLCLECHSREVLYLGNTNPRRCFIFGGGMPWSYQMFQLPNR